MVLILARFMHNALFSVQGDHLSGKSRNVGEFGSCQGSFGKAYSHRKLLIINFTFGVTPPVFSNLLQALRPLV